MQRSKLLASNVDKQWEADRRGARRAEVRLSNGLHELEEAQHYHVNSMTKEQKLIQRELARIKQVSAQNKTTNPTSLPLHYKTGRQRMLPTISAGMGHRSRLQMGGESIRKQSAPIPEGPVMASGSSMTLQMRINDFMDGVSSKMGKTETPVCRSRAESSLSDISITHVKNSIAKRLSISDMPTVMQGSINNDEQGDSSGLMKEASDKEQESTMKAPKETAPRSEHPATHSARQRRGSLKGKPVFDEEFYAPDGSIRTMHTMPDLMESLEEAKKARYIRHRCKPDSERELSVQEIFQ
ncbi:coiled-coil domain-containing protein 190 [Ascaphus truei]|uniref:coiled-coil domain-containing protein 190 n=1 Tax=Ascaphus truei TaxID=8439 RepID=UPI003F5A4B5C